MTNESETYEQLVPDEVDEDRREFRALSYENFKPNETPVFSDVKILQRHSYWDGPLSGICEIHGEQFYFANIIESVWRFYDKQTKEVGDDGKKFQLSDRLWRIFAVYDASLSEIYAQYAGGGSVGESVEKFAANNYNCIGIFWDYTYDLEKDGE